ncbi:MAG: Smr/MutS family protein [Candidatus Cloacimonetes bacterium]|nr:Smr/MutS family protein [Candidatus Cloacimonadota bacterium]
MNALRQLEFDQIIDLLATECHNEAGKALAAATAPLSDATDIRHRLALTGELQLLLRRGHTVDLRGVSEIARLLHEPEHDAYGFAECGLICANVLAANHLPRTIDEHEEFPLYCAILDRVEPLPAIEKRFGAIFSSEGEVKDTASTALAGIRKRRRNVRTNIYGTLEKRMSDIPQLLSDAIVTERDNRFVIPVKQGSETFVPGMVHGRSGSRATVFVEPTEVVALNNELSTLGDDEREEILRILIEFSHLLREHTDTILANTAELGKLDCFFAAARLANRLDAHIPRIIDEPRLRLDGVRHPLLIVGFGDRDKVIPFDIELGGERRVMVLSGPNTGGKTVTLKATGLLTAMALSGLPIPAADTSEVGLFTRIFADIGDSQSLAGALSTFSAHVQRLQAMLEHGDERSLTLADEIGSATDPEQGSALAQAMLERLVERGVVGLVTTHYTALKVFAENAEACVNASMHFDPDRLTPTFQFKLGLPGNSFAIDVARHLGLDETLIGRARQLAGEQNVELTDMIRKMSREKRELARQSYELKLKGSLLALKTGEYEKKLAAIERDRNQLRREMLHDARDWLADMQRELQAEVDDIRKLGRAEQKARLEEVTASVSHRQREMADEEKRMQPGRQKLGAPEVGQRVWVEDFEDSGEIVEIGRDRVRVNVNGIHYTTTVDRLAVAPPPEKPVTGGHVVSETHEGSSLELNIIGKTFDEAEPELAGFIDNAIFQGLGKVRIVHGKGTGALRTKVRGWLRRHRRCGEFYSAARDAGGDGVTVVGFK